MPIPAAYIVKTSKRRRLWGEDMPDDWIGTDFRFFGGWNYGYKFPPGTTTTSGNSLLASTKMMTTVSFSQTILVLLGCLTQHPTNVVAACRLNLSQRNYWLHGDRYSLQNTNHRESCS